MGSATYSPAGSYAAFAGTIVLILAHFGIITDVNSVISIIGSIVLVVGLIHQFLNHRKIASAAGMI